MGLPKEKDWNFYLHPTDFFMQSAEWRPRVITEKHKKMKSIQIKAEKRDIFGKKESKKLQREGLIPCGLYGNGETIHFSLGVKEVKPLIYSPNSYIVKLDVNGKEELAVIREVQFHPVKEQILHIDFYRAVPGKEVAIDIPVKLKGNSVGVRMGGKLSLSKRKIHVKGLLENLPDELTIDVTNLELGKSIFVGDLNYEGLTLLTPATTAICAVKMTRAARGAAAAAAAAEAE